MAKSQTSMSRLRILTLITADILLLSCATTTLLLPYIPLPIRVQDSVDLAGSYAVYLQLGIIFSLVGLFGAWRQSATHTHIFATFLLLDTLVSVLPRVLLLAFLYQPARTFCPPSSAFTAYTTSVNSLPTAITASSTPPTPRTALDVFTTELFVRATTAWAELSSSWSSQDCAVIVSIAQAGLGVIMVLLGVMQAAAAVAVRRYALTLSVRERERACVIESRVVGEAHGYEDRKGRFLVVDGIARTNYVEYGGDEKGLL